MWAQWQTGDTGAFLSWWSFKVPDRADPLDLDLGACVPIAVLQPVFIPFRSSGSLSFLRVTHQLPRSIGSSFAHRFPTRVPKKERRKKERNRQPRSSAPAVLNPVDIDVTVASHSPPRSVQVRFTHCDYWTELSRSQDRQLQPSPERPVTPSRLFTIVASVPLEPVQDTYKVGLFGLDLFDSLFIPLQILRYTSGAPPPARRIRCSAVVRWPCTQQTRYSRNFSRPLRAFAYQTSVLHDRWIAELDHSLSRLVSLRCQI